MICALACTLTWWSLPLDVRAQDTRERMHELNERGFEAFQVNKFDLAASIFAEAYAIESDPNLKKNEAIALLRAQRLEEAQNAAELALTLSPPLTPADRLEAERVVSVCALRLGERAAARGDDEQAERLLAAVSSPRLNDQERIDLAGLRGTLLERRVERSETIKRVDSVPSNRLSTGLMIGGAALTGAAIAYHAWALTASDDFIDEAGRGTDRARYDNLRGRVETARWVAPTLYVAGLSTAAVGLGMRLLSDGKHEEY